MAERWKKVFDARPTRRPLRPTWTTNDASSNGEFEQHRFALRSVTVLFLVSGITTALGGAFSSRLNGGERTGLIVVGGVLVVAAGLVTAGRRHTWNRAALLALVVPALVAFGVGNFTAPDPYIASIYLYVIAVWVGVSQRRGVNAALAPFYAVTYWLPLWLVPHGPTLDGSVPYVVIVAVVTGETVAWLTSRLASTSDRLRDRDQQRFAALAEESSDVTVVLDRFGTISYISESVASVFGYPVEVIEGFPVADVMARYLDPAGMGLAAERLEVAMRPYVVQDTFTTRIRHADGRWRNLRVEVRNLLENDAVSAVLLDLWDVTDRVEAQASLDASEESFRLLFQLSPLPTMVFDPVGLGCLRVNDAACDHYGYTRAELLAMTIVDLLPPDDVAAAALADRSAGDGPAGDGPAGAESVGADSVGADFVGADSAADGPGVGNRSASGYLRPGLWQHQTKSGRVIDVEIMVNRTPFAGVDACTVLVVDVTEQRLRERQLRHEALHDTLTGLANRALLLDRLDRALRATSHKPGSVAVLFCDVDGFKAVNDRLGHAAGDEVLRMVAARLQNLVRSGDTVARFDADQFAILVEQIDDPGTTQALANRINLAMAPSTTFDGRQINATLSIGIAFGTATSGPDEVCRNADAAMREAKLSGRSCYRVFEVAMRANTARRLELSNDLLPALQTGQFQLQYQPHVALATGAIQGFEALVRWDHPTYGMVDPLDFIPLAEETGLIVPLGRWILATACAEAAHWPDAPSGPITIAVNLSVRQLRSATILDDVHSALTSSGLPPERLVLEITESVLMADTDAAMGLIDQFKALGVGLAIDDFGTGYSSLSYLRRFDFDVLKIDKSFVDGLTDHPDRGSAFVRTIVTLGHTLGMRIITEGIETAEQYRTLTRLGSDAGQGFLMSRPLDAEAAMDLLGRPVPDYAAAELVG